jgi:hypothetical protein
MADPPRYTATDDSRDDSSVRPGRASTTGTSRWHQAKRSFRASPGFSLAVLVTLGLAGLIGLMTLLMSVLGGFLGMAHFTEPHHRIHDLTYGFLFTTAVVGLLAQLLRPSRNMAGMLMALIPWVGLLLAAALSTEPGVIRSAERILVGAGTVTAAVLHPARRDLFRSLRVSRVNPVMLGLIIIAAVPLLASASTNLGLQGSLANEHAGMGHYGFMAAFSFTVIGVGLVASLRPPGWRVAAWVAGALPALLGIASLLFPDVDSSLGLAWALAAIVWGGAFMASVLVKNTVEPTPTSAVAKAAGEQRAREEEEMRMAEPPSDAKGGMPRWLKVSLIIVAVLAVLVVVLMLTGVLGGQHGPGPVRTGAARLIEGG